LVASFACYLATARLWGVDPDDAPGLFVLGAVMVLAAAHLLVGVFDTEGPRSAWLVAAGGAVVIVNLFFGLESLSHFLLHDVVPEEPAAGAVFVLLALLVVSAFTVVLWLVTRWSRGEARSTALAVHIRNGLYANALFDRLVDMIWSRPDTTRVPTRNAQETPC
jgi:NAD(P)H-quinone oxidoreductase subunit 5